MQLSHIYYFLNSRIFYKLKIRNSKFLFPIYFKYLNQPVYWKILKYIKKLMIRANNLRFPKHEKTRLLIEK
ncbi:unnamed protein product [Blepharisma stoltei]|uniref:Uncharacterized protein n=1 Tax=Blepharisma stoltei TaxID=1481888 RepID=A0AAU9JQ31_9CILI|nr:unnamed protein product [Blepharisma stoltei]